MSVPKAFVVPLLAAVSLSPPLVLWSVARSSASAGAFLAVVHADQQLRLLADRRHRLLQIALERRQQAAGEGAGRYLFPIFTLVAFALLGYAVRSTEGAGAARQSLRLGTGRVVALPLRVLALHCTAPLLPARPLARPSGHGQPPTALPRPRASFQPTPHAHA